MGREPSLYSQPVGFFVTLSAYGNRLHGDERGTVDWLTNDYGEPPLPTDGRRSTAERQSMSWPPMTFSSGVRRVIEEAIAEVCVFRGWTLHACHARTNHVHVVVSANASTSRILHDLKATPTRRLRAAGLVPGDRPIWAEHGSTVYLWNESDVFAAADYVVNGQGTELPGSLRPGPWLNAARTHQPKSEDPQ